MDGGMEGWKVGTEGQSGEVGKLRSCETPNAKFFTFHFSLFTKKAERKTPNAKLFPVLSTSTARRKLPGTEGSSQGISPCGRNDNSGEGTKTQNPELRTPINACPPLAGMMKCWKHKTSKFGILRFIKTSSDYADCTDFYFLPLSGKHPFHPLNPTIKKGVP